MTSSKPALALLAAILTARPEVAAVAATDPANPDWPCVQRKVVTLTSAQMWDGPAVDDLARWRDDADIVRLVAVLANRRVPLDDAAAAVAAFGAAQPQAERDDRLKLLFAGLLGTMNSDRAVVLDGIERFQRRQRGRAAELERQGDVIRQLKDKAAADASVRAELAAAESRYDWDARVFTERQRSLPLACEIPVLIEQRLFAIGREIRSHMSD